MNWVARSSCSKSLYGGSQIVLAVLIDELEMILSLCSFFGRSGRAPKPLDSLIYVPSPHLLVLCVSSAKPARFLSGNIGTTPGLGLPGKHINVWNKCLRMSDLGLSNVLNDRRTSFERTVD